MVAIYEGCFEVFPKKFNFEEYNLWFSFDVFIPLKYMELSFTVMFVIFFNSFDEVVIKLGPKPILFVTMERSVSAEM